jgi:hypothetical protein
MSKHLLRGWPTRGSSGALGARTGPQPRSAPSSSDLDNLLDRVLAETTARSLLDTIVSEADNAARRKQHRQDQMNERLLREILDEHSQKSGKRTDARKVTRSLATLIRRRAPVPFQAAMRFAQMLLQQAGLMGRLEGTEITGWDIPGYTLAEICNALPINWQARAAGCNLFQAGGDPVGTVYAPGPPEMVLANRYPVSTGFRYDSVQRWTRDAIGNSAVPAPVRSPVTRTVETVRRSFPNVDPDMFPPGVSLDPLPLPYRLRNSKRYTDTYQGHHRERVSRRPKRMKGYEVAASRIEATITVDPKTDTAFVGQPPPPDHAATHLLVPPRRGEKETKFSGRLGGVHRFLVTWGMTPTEWLDFLDALYAALPGEVRSNPRYHGNVSNRVRAVYENLEKIDVAQAIENVILNQIEDAIIGRAQGALARYGKSKMGEDGFQRFRMQYTQLMRQMNYGPSL